MAGGKGGRLGRDEVLLHAGQKRLAFIKRKADCLQSLMVLVDRQHVGVIADDFAAVTHDPQLYLDRHNFPPPDEYLSQEPGFGLADRARRLSKAAGA